MYVGCVLLKSHYLHPSLPPSLHPSLPPSLPPSLLSSHLSLQDQPGPSLHVGPVHQRGAGRPRPSPQLRHQRGGLLRHRPQRHQGGRGHLLHHRRRGHLAGRLRGPAVPPAGPVVDHVPRGVHVHCGGAATGEARAGPGQRLRGAPLLFRRRSTRGRADNGRTVQRRPRGQGRGGAQVVGGPGVCRGGRDGGAV